MSHSSADDPRKRAAFEDFLRTYLDESARAEAIRHSSVVCGAGPGTPVLYVSDAFEAHTGWRLADVAGRSLSLLQGPLTEPESIEAFRTLIAERRPGTVRVTNYRPDGRPFVHECALRPVKDPNGETAYFVAVQRLVT